MGSDRRPYPREARPPERLHRAAAPGGTRYIRYEHRYVGSSNLAISDIRVFGNGGGGRPAAPDALVVRRDTDARNAFVTWKAVGGAVGYNVLWGIKPDKLYETYQVF